MFEVNRELNKIDEYLNKFRTEEQILEEDKATFFPIKASIIYYQVFGFFFLVKDSLTENYQEPLILYIYWPFWWITLIGLAYSHWAQKPHVIRVLCHMHIIRNIMPWFNYGKRKSFQDIATLVHFSHLQNIYINIILVVISFCESYKVHLPTSVFYQFFLSYG